MVTIAKGPCFPDCFGRVTTYRCRTISVQPALGPRPRGRSRKCHRTDAAGPPRTHQRQSAQPRALKLRIRLDVRAATCGLVGRHRDGPAMI